MARREIEPGTTIVSGKYTYIYIYVCVCEGEKVIEMVTYMYSRLGG